jgi:hypothetical protein
MAYSRTRRKRKRPPSEAALLHHRDIASLAMEFFSVLDGDDLEPVRDAADPLLNGLISKSSASPILRHLGHRRCSTDSVIIMPDRPATNGSPSEQFRTLPQIRTRGIKYGHDRRARHMLTVASCRCLLGVNRVTLTVGRPLPVPSGPPRSTDIVRPPRHIGLVPRH